MISREEMRLAAEEMDALKDSGHEFDGLVRVEARVAPSPGAYVTLQMTGAEISTIANAAREAGEDVNEFILEAAMARVDEFTSKRKSKKKASA